MGNARQHRQLPLCAGFAGARGQRRSPPNGDITVFSIARDTGRLSLVLNQQIKDPITGAQLTYFPVGKSPSMMQLAGGGCLLTLDKGDQTVFPYSVSGGQLVLTTNSTIPLNTTRRNLDQRKRKQRLHHGCGRAQHSRDRFCLIRSAVPAALNTANGGAVPNLPFTSRPTYTMVNSKGTYLYVLNQSTTDSNAASYSSISAFTIDDHRQAAATRRFGSGKQSLQGRRRTGMHGRGSNEQVCLHLQQRRWHVSGFQLDDRSGQLLNLTRGSTFTAVGQATCLAISPNVQ